MKSLARQLREKDQKIAAKAPLERLVRASRYKPKLTFVAKTYWVSHVLKINAEPKSPATKRVERFIELFKLARELNDSFRLFFDSEDEMFAFLHQPKGPVTYDSKSPTATKCTFKVPGMEALNQRLNRVLGELNRLLTRYKVYPYVRHLGFEFSGFDVTQDWDSRDTDQGWETGAIWWLQGQNARWVDYFRRCGQCRRWFFAEVEHQSFCKPSCRKLHHSQGEEFKERRRLYMRRYRRDENERASRAKTAVKRTH